MGENSDTGYLIRRAFLVLESCGGTASKDLLVQALFGAASHQGVWEKMLDNLLGSSKWFEACPEGWRIAGSDGTSGNDYVVLHIETTGLRATHQRIVEIGLRRVSQGKQQDAYFSLINPQRKLPYYVTRATGITQDMLDESPPFGEIAGDIIDMIEFRPLVGHDIEIQAGFLNYELKRCGYRPLLNDRIDIVRLVVESIPDLGKPSLERVAGRLGVALPLRRRGETIVDVVAEVYRKIRAGEYGTPDKPREEPKNRLGTIISRPDWLYEMPETPGVYVMKDGAGQVIYVGKALNLKQRVSTYYALASSQNRNLDGLLESLDHVDFVETESGDEALLLEAQLIAQYDPQYNTQKNGHVPRPVLRIDFTEPFPRIQACPKPAADDAHYFGPYPNGTIAKKVRDYLNYGLGLRTCQRKLDGKKRRKPLQCIELSRGPCLAPCANQIGSEQYTATVQRVASYLSHEGTDILDDLWISVREARAAQDAVRAARIKEGIEFLEAVISPEPSGTDVTIEWESSR